MTLSRILIVSSAILFAAWATFQLELFSLEFKERFLYLGNWPDLIALMALILAIGGILKLLASMTYTGVRKK